MSSIIVNKTLANQFRLTFVYGVLSNLDNSSNSIPARAAFQRDVFVGGNLFLGKGELDASGAFLDSSSNIQFTLNKEIINIPVKCLNYIKNVTSDIQQQIIDLSNNIINNGGSPPSTDISTLQNKTRDISWTDNKTTISNYCFTSSLFIANYINNIPVIYINNLIHLNNLRGNVQAQIENCNSNISTLQNKTTDIAWTSGQINKTSIYYQCETQTLSFSNTLNNISTTTFGYLSGLTSNIQDQINTLTNNLSEYVSSLQNQINALINNTPPGTVIAFAGSRSFLNGYLLCDGSIYNSQNYNALFNAIGTIYGDAGNGNFRVPNYKGIFLRGAGDQNVQLNIIAGGGGALFKYFQSPDLGKTVIDQSTYFSTNNFVNNITTGSKTVVTGMSPNLGTLSTTSVIGNINFTTNNNVFNFGNEETHPAHASVQYFIKY